MYSHSYWKCSNTLWKAFIVWIYWSLTKLCSHNQRVFTLRIFHFQWLLLYICLYSIMNLQSDLICNANTRILKKRHFGMVKVLIMEKKNWLPNKFSIAIWILADFNGSSEEVEIRTRQRKVNMERNGQKKGTK